MQKLKTVSFYLLVIALLLATGFYRDFVFKSINALLQAWDANVDYYLPPSLRFFENYEYDTLLRIKWILTFAFSLVYLLISVITIRYIFGRKKLIMITVWTYAGIMLLSGIFMLTGIIFSSASEKMYEFARYFMGMAQSPLILMILIPVFKLAEKENTAAAK
ncbi:MAG: hypothetical protein JWO44_1568 [Bacteroidetes bacterium]|nr:hypothetical protein [Bacteroidota bacterium]